MVARAITAARPLEHERARGSLLVEDDLSFGPLWGHTAAKMGPNTSGARMGPGPPGGAQAYAQERHCCAESSRRG